ncbi:protein O-linked-mannose beta-1,2-N-acetylglucosaminyltransferase 1-like [Homarus americanus]|uniref:protein O-linked-mannose beta-1,2-N-acetylglucosaminyltransferase 1-like n=1 Tax=Homarus americanus TaxID=6706 RepID=UPI001C494859|nr:protein O-linked-mannose beta-1,2-N-acetylglucosaminyltransferase 1-like [Homarus americanus]
MKQVTVLAVVGVGVFYLMSLTFLLVWYKHLFTTEEGVPQLTNRAHTRKDKVVPPVHSHLHYSLYHRHHHLLEREEESEGFLSMAYRENNQSRDTETVMGVSKMADVTTINVNKRDGDSKHFYETRANIRRAGINNRSTANVITKQDATKRFSLMVTRNRHWRGRKESTTNTLRKENISEHSTTVKTKIKTVGENLEAAEDEDGSDTSSGVTELVERGVDIDVQVSKWSLVIKVNGKQVVQENMELTDVKFMRKGGLYLTVLHPSSASVVHFSKHRTFETSGDEGLLRVVEGVQTGRILVLANMHEGFMQLSNEAVHLLANHGSTAILDNTIGDRWAWIWTKGGRTWAEAVVFSVHSAKFQLQGGPIHLHVHLPHVSLTECECPSWPRGGVWETRRKFCQKYDGYGDLCDCDHPRPLPPTSPPPSPSQVRDVEVRTIPTVVVASERPLYLDRCLRRLLSVAGSNPRQTLVVADGHPNAGLREVSALASLYGLKFLGHDSGGHNSTLRITRHYKVVFDSAFITFPKANQVIILEEDLYVAADFYNYFTQLAPLLEADSTLYCVSAWNDLSLAGSGGDPALVMRSETMAGLGWLLSRNIYDEIIPKWPAYDKYADWDMWLRLPAQQKGRECLVPEVSRTYHFGITGVHLTAHFQATHFAHTALNTHPHVKLKDLHRLGPKTYDALLKEMLIGGIHLDGGATNPCSADLLPRNSTHHHVLWIKMNQISDDYTLMGVMSCLLLWDLDVRGQHNLLWRLRWRGTTLLLVGWPASPFSTLKPKDVRIMMRYDPKSRDYDPPVYQYLNPNTTTTPQQP